LGVTATSEVVIRGLDIGVENPALAVFAIGVYKDGVLVASGRAMVNRAGTYTATISPVDLVPGVAYHFESSLAVVTRNSPGSRGMAYDAVIKEIRWSF